MLRVVEGAVWILLASGMAVAEPVVLEAPGMGATPANQLVVSGNACGPTALLNALRFANRDWQRAYKAIEGSSDKEKIYQLIRESGMRPSKHLAGRPRWSRKGVNIADLCDMANETAAGHYLPTLNQEVLFSAGGNAGPRLLRSTHHKLADSLRKGFPPIISLRRYVNRKLGDGFNWVILDAHFVTLVSVPRSLGKEAVDFPVIYVDPWGGKQCRGRICVADRPALAATIPDSPCLLVDFPDAAVGRKLARPGESSVLTLAAAMGRW